MYAREGKQCHVWLAAFLLFVSTSVGVKGFSVRSVGSRNVSLDRLTRQQHGRRNSALSLGGLEDAFIPVPTMIQSTLEASSSLLIMDKDTAEAIAGPFFGLSLFPYLAFIWFLNKTEDCPKGVVVGFAACLVFVFLTIPAAILAKVWYSVSLADCDWLHGSAESLLTITNLCTVIPFRQALQAKEANLEVPPAASTYGPTVLAVASLAALAVATAVVPALDPATTVHTPYLNGILDLPRPSTEPENALSVATWIIHVSSLVEFLVAMGFCWKWAALTGKESYKGLTWGLLPLHSSGITACVSHLFYNSVPVLVPLQAMLTCVGNLTAAFAAWRIVQEEEQRKGIEIGGPIAGDDTSGLVGFEDLGQALAEDADWSFVVKLFVGCALFSFAIKYGEVALDFNPSGEAVSLALLWIFVPTALNAYKWRRRSDDATFEGWF